MIDEVKREAVEWKTEMRRSSHGQSGQLIAFGSKYMILTNKDGSVRTDGKVQQEVVAGSLDEIGSNSIVSAWGERRGDRLVARVVSFTPAQTIPAPNQ